jgi:hypothetical protein
LAKKGKVFGIAAAANADGASPCMAEEFFSVEAP